MPFTHKTWVNSPSTTTPINAAALMDVEDRVVVGSADALVSTYAGSDINITSAASSSLHTGTFVPLGTVAEVTVRVHALNTNQLAGYMGLVFFYSTNSQPIWPDNQASDRSGVTRVNLGGLSGQPATLERTIKLTGLTAGATYNFSVAGGIIGYASTVTTTDALTNISVSNQSAIATDVGDFGDAILAATSQNANRLYIIRSNHWVRIDDEFYTGSTGIDLTSGRGAGSVAISPNRKRVVVTNFSLNNLTLFDLSNLSQPTVIGNNLSTMTGPYAVAITPDSTTAWLADFGQALPHVQKITGIDGGSPAAASSIQLDSSASNNITHISITPDGTKAVCCGGSTKVFVVNTSTNGVTVRTVPSGNANAVGILSNTEALVHYSTNQVAIMNLSTGTFGTAFTTATAPTHIAAYKDGLTTWNIKNTNVSDNLTQINLPVNTGNSAPVEFTHLNQPGLPQDACIDDRGNLYVLTNTPNTLVTYYGSQFLCRPSGAGQSLGEGIQVHVRPAS